MKDLIILTDKPIDKVSCYEILITNFCSLNIFNTGNDSLLMKKQKRGFEIWFTPDDVLDNPECMMDDTIDKCPNKKAFLTNLSYTSETIAKKVIELLKPLYGNMWIQSDEEDDWFGTADEFINKQLI